MPAVKVNVVIADDVPFIRMGMRRILEKNPDVTIVGEASNGLDALQLVEKHHVDILLLDIQMPDMDGIEVLSRLKQKAVSVIVVSGFADNQMTEGLLSEGALAVFAKESVHLKLQEEVSRILAAKKAITSWAS